MHLNSHPQVPLMPLQVPSTLDGAMSVLPRNPVLPCLLLEALDPDIEVEHSGRTRSDPLDCIKSLGPGFLIGSSCSLSENPSRGS